MKKRLIGLLTVLTLLAALLPQTAVLAADEETAEPAAATAETADLADGPLRLFINEEEYNFKISALAEGGVAYVPMRYVLQAFGQAVSWSERKSTVLAVDAATGAEVTVNTGTITATREGKEIRLTGLKSTEEGLLVPPDFFRDVYGARVSVDSEERIIYIEEEDYMSEEEAMGNLPDVDPVMTEENLFAATLKGPEYGTMEQVDAEGMPFTKAVRVTTTSKPANNSDFQLEMDVPEGISKGDIVLCRVWVRTVEAENETGLCTLRWVCELNAAPWTKSYQNDFSAEREWTQIYWSFQSGYDWEANGFHVTMPVGYRPQILEVGGFELFNFGDGLSMNQLPGQKTTYTGRRADAAWRDEAWERIDQIRKADLNVQVVDQAGNPVEDAAVDVTMVRNAFQLGSAINLYQMNGSYDGVQYQQAVENLFNTVTFENSLKWPAREKNGEPDDLSLDVLRYWTNWLNDRNIWVRGHNLIWDDADRFMPSDMQNMVDNASLEELRIRIDTEMRYALEAFQGAFWDWDVVNEPTEKNDIITKYGLEEVKRWYELAGEIDPTVVRVLNDYTIGTTKNNPKAVLFLKVLKDWTDYGIPFDAVGIQSHLSSVRDPMEFYEEYNQVAEYGKPIRITELGLYIGDEELQGDFIRDFMIMAYSHPSVESIISWGFWDGNHFMNNAPIFRKDWSIKPSGQYWINLVKREWTTDVRRTTNADGEISVRGFKGDYDIKVVQNGKTEVFQATLNEDMSLVLTLGTGTPEAEYTGWTSKYKKLDIDAFVDEQREIPETDESQALLDSLTATGPTTFLSDFESPAFGATGNEFQGTNLEAWKTGVKPTAAYTLLEENGNRFVRITTEDTAATDPYMYARVEPGGLLDEDVAVSARIRLGGDQPVGTQLRIDFSSGAASVTQLAVLRAYEEGKGQLFGVGTTANSTGFAWQAPYTPDEWVTVTAVFSKMNERRGKLDFYVNGKLMVEGWKVNPKALSKVDGLRIYTGDLTGSALQADVDDLIVIKPFLD